MTFSPPPDPTVGHGNSSSHSPDDELTLTALATPDVAATVRSLLSLRAPEWRLSPSMTDDATVCAAELVTNACNATQNEKITFRAIFDPAATTLWIGVWDSSPFKPVVRSAELTLADIDALPDDHRFGGWGLPLVMSLATHHGIADTLNGKWVYAVLQAPHRP